MMTPETNKQQIKELRDELQELKTAALLAEEKAGLERDIWKSKHPGWVDSYYRARKDTKELGSIIANYFRWVADNQKLQGGTQMETDTTAQTLVDEAVELVKEESYDDGLTLDMEYAPQPLEI